MIIRVVKDKDNPYVMMNKSGLNDPRLSFKAKGKEKEKNHDG